MTSISERKILVQALWQTGTKNPVTLHNKTKTPFSTLYSWIEKLSNGQSLDRKLYSKRESKIPPSIRKKVIRKMSNKKQPSLRKTAKDTGLSHETVRKILKSTRFIFKIKQKKVKITADHRLKRLRFAKEMMKTQLDFGYYFFTDEASIWLERALPKGNWSKENSRTYNVQMNRERFSQDESIIEEEFENSFESEDSSMEIEEGDEEEELVEGRHGPKIHLWGGISARGATRLQIFEDNLTGKRYIKILRERKKDMDNLYPEGYYFQQDGNPCHTSKKSILFISQNFNRNLNWPPSSPDLSPIENIWGWLKREINNEKPSSLTAVKRIAKKYWARLTPYFLANYINSMPRRLEQVILNNGGRINY